MFCSNCGKEIKEGQKFCSNCGAAVNGSVRSAFEQVRDSAKEGFENAGDKARDAFEQAKTAAAGVGSQVDSAIDQVRQDFSGGPVPGPGVPLVTDRSLAAYILLSIITCGIYGYYFIYAVARDVNVACADDGEETAGLGMYLLLSILTCGFYNLYWMYKLGNRLSSNAPRYGLSFQENGSSILLWKIFGALICGVGSFIGDYILIKNTNAICNAYNRQHGM